MPHDHDPHSREAPRGRYLVTLSVAALGVVYGDIGTSPLYALRECFYGEHAIPPTATNIMGVLSMVLWALVLVISLKYITFVLRADNQGEGGILALTALATPIKILSRKERWPLVLLGIFGAALLYGDGMITPAISVLSAVEGLSIGTPIFEPFVVPITIGILIGLFLIQSHGTGGVGRIFGPVTFVWFVTIGLLGAIEIGRHPGVLAAVNPMHAVDFFLANGWDGYFILGTVVLAITGGESLYVDLGHFGPRPIRLVWFAVVMPALLLNYFGQGALLMSEPESASNPFFFLAPDWAVYPLVALATCATVIASQAVISGAFSITMQAVQFGFLPRLTITHTSSREFGQIYIPSVNWALMIACILLVIGFGASSALAAAYGIAVISAMTITSLMFLVVARDRWGWSLAVVVPLVGTFLAIDLAFFGANIVKVPHGGWFPLVAAAAIFAVMTTWKQGRRTLTQLLVANALPFETFLADIRKHPPLRVPGTAIFMNGNLGGTPAALLHNVRHNHVLHERNILITATVKQVPRVDPSERTNVEHLGDSFWRIVVNYGFTEEPDVPAALADLAQPDLPLDLDTVTYFLGRETLIATRHVNHMADWREKLFVTMQRNATNATSYFRLPSNRVIEVGSQIEI
ncbi:MAG TPA: potassium transporter Kup [Vicinamibacterales bacterium]|nr:potassium transporter Kup [Vicinamibacterales bacterium]